MFAPRCSVARVLTAALALLGLAACSSANKYRAASKVFPFEEKTFVEEFSSSTSFSTSQTVDEPSRRIKNVATEDENQASGQDIVGLDEEELLNGDRLSPLASFKNERRGRGRGARMGRSSPPRARIALPAQRSPPRRATKHETLLSAIIDNDMAAVIDIMERQEPSACEEGDALTMAAYLDRLEIFVMLVDKYGADLNYSFDLPFAMAMVGKGFHVAAFIKQRGIKEKAVLEQFGMGEMYKVGPMEYLSRREMAIAVTEAVRRQKQEERRMQRLFKEEANASKGGSTKAPSLCTMS